MTARDPSADRRDGFTALFGASPDVCHQRLKRPEPQVIGAPPADLVEQGGIDPSPDHRRRPQRILGLVVLGLRVGPVFGKVTLADAFELERPLPVALASSMASAASSSRTSPGKVLFFGCSGASRWASSPSFRSWAIPDSATLIASARSSAVGPFCFAITMKVSGPDDTPPGT